MHRIFVPKEQIPIITGSDIHQIKDVLRLKVGNEIELLDGSGKVYLAKIKSITNEKIITEIISTSQNTGENKIKVTLAQCLPKAKKMDLIIQKCTELGVHRIIPVLSERSIAKGEKLERWKKIAKEAAEQSGRSTMPEISNLTNFEDLLKLRKDYDLALIPWELEKEKSLKSLLTTQPPCPELCRGANNLLIIIGPEGGFSAAEINLAKESGFTPVSLGKRILRTETAGMAILAMLSYEYD